MSSSLWLPCRIPEFTSTCSSQIWRTRVASVPQNVYTNTDSCPSVLALQNLRDAAAFFISSSLSLGPPRVAGAEPSPSPPVVSDGTARAVAQALAKPLAERFTNAAAFRAALPQPQRTCSTRSRTINGGHDMIRPCTGATAVADPSVVEVKEERAMVRVRFRIIRNVRIANVGKYQSCMVSKLRITWKQTVVPLRLVCKPEMKAPSLTQPAVEKQDVPCRPLRSDGVRMERAALLRAPHVLRVVGLSQTVRTRHHPAQTLALVSRLKSAYGCVYR